MRLILVGGGGHASDVLDAIEAADETVNRSPVLGIVDDRDDLGPRFDGRVKHLGPISQVGMFEATHYILAVGWPTTRAALAERMPRELEPATVLHPLADVSRHADAGPGTVVLSSARVSPFAQLGRHVYVGYQAAVGHDSVVGAFTSVMPGAKISGECRVGEGVMIGSNAVVREGLTIGEGAVVGAGAVVLENVPAGTTVLGVPAVAR